MSFISRRGLLSASAAVSVTACASAPAVPAQLPLPQGWTLDATEMALRIRRGELSALEAVEAAIGRVQRLQPVLNVIVNSSFDQALERARSGGLSGPFAGVPFLIKDLNDVPGLPTRDGSASTLGLPAATQMDATALRFQRAGLVSLGKSATPEHGFLPTTEPLVFGPTRNPWDLDHSAGGSSGGAAAAVAAGIVPVAHASDGGGSIRIPASCCGLFGLKPSRGRTVQEDPAQSVTDLGVEHVVSHSVRDSAAILGLTERPGPHPPVGYVTEPSARRLRVGLVIDTATGVTPDREVTAAIESTAALMTDLGHTVEPTTWPIDGDSFADDFLTLWAMGAAQVLKDAGNPTLLEPFTVGLARMLATLPAARTEGLVERLETVARQYDGWFADFDVILSPVLAKPPVPLGHLRGDLPFEELRERLTAYVGYTPLHNVAGAPAMSVPLTWTPAGLPVGSHFAARVGDEKTLLELAYELEAARPWVLRRPPIASFETAAARLPQDDELGSASW